MARKSLYDETQNMLVSSLIANGKDVDRVLEIISENDIEDPKLNLIFQAMIDISRKGENVSAISLAEVLESKGELKKIGGNIELYSMREYGFKVLKESTSEFLAKMAKELSVKSKIAKIVKDSVKAFDEDSGTTASDGLSDLQNKLTEQNNSLSDDSTVVNANEAAEDYFDVLEKREEISKENSSENYEGLQGIPSSLPKLNSLTTGWLPGELITVGARTGIGKSIFAVNCATAAAQAGKSVLFLSLEMDQEAIFDRIIASISGVTLDRLRQGELTDEEKENIKNCLEEQKKSMIKIDTNPKVTIDSIRAKAQQMAQSPTGLDFIIVDYLQLITPPGGRSRNANRQEIVAEISRNMKLLAKQLQVPIMVLVQLNRQGKDEVDAMPRIDDVRESGAIAQDSDIVILLHRESSFDGDPPPTKVILGKNRNGESDKIIVCESLLGNSRFREFRHSPSVERMTDEDFDTAESGFIDDIDVGDF